MLVVVAIAIFVFAHSFVCFKQMSLFHNSAELFWFYVHITAEFSVIVFEARSSFSLFVNEEIVSIRELFSGVALDGNRLLVLDGRDRRAGSIPIYVQSCRMCGGW